MAVVDELLIRLGADMTPMEESFKSAGRTTRRFVDKIERYGKKLDRMRITPVVRLTDKASPKLQRVEGKLRHFSRQTYKATIKLKDRATRGLDSMKKKMSSLKTPALVGGIGAGLLGYDTIKQFATYEQELANVRSITGATNEEMEKMNKLAKEQADRTMFSPRESAEAMRYLGMAGFETKEILGALPGMLDVAASSAIDLGRAADISSNILTGFNLKASESNRVADVLAKTVTSANVTMEELGNTMSYVAPVAASVGVSLEEAAAAAGALGSAGIKSSKAGTTLRTALIRLSDPPKEALTQMQKLGIEIENEEGKFKSLGTILSDFKKKTKDMNKSDKLQAISQIFGRRAASGMLKLIKESEDEFDNLVKKLNDAGGTASEVAEQKLDTLIGSLRLLYSRVQLLQIELGEELGPVIRDFSDWLRDQIPYIKDWAQEVMPKAADGLQRLTNRFQEYVKTLRDSEKFQNMSMGSKIATVLTDALNEVIPTAGEIGTKMGSRIIIGFGKGVATAISNDPLSATLIGVWAGTKTPGPIQAKVAVAVSIAALPWVKGFLKWAFSGIGKRTKGTTMYVEEKLKEKEEAWDLAGRNKSTVSPHAGFKKPRPSIEGGKIQSREASRWEKFKDFFGFASGGIVNSPHMGLVGEAGPESIIPLSSKMRDRAIDLWHRTGEHLGMSSQGATSNVVNVGDIIVNVEKSDTENLDENELAEIITSKIVNGIQLHRENSV